MKGTKEKGTRAKKGRKEGHKRKEGRKFIKGRNEGYKRKEGRNEERKGGYMRRKAGKEVVVIKGGKEGILLNEERKRKE